MDAFILEKSTWQCLILRFFPSSYRMARVIRSFCRLYHTCEMWSAIQGEPSHHGPGLGWLWFWLFQSARFCLDEWEFGRMGWAARQDRWTIQIKVNSTQVRDLKVHPVFYSYSLWESTWLIYSRNRKSHDFSLTLETRGAICFNEDLTKGRSENERRKMKRTLIIMLQLRKEQKERASDGIPFLLTAASLS